MPSLILTRIFLATAAVFGGLSVAGGAFASHALKDKLSDRALEIFDTAARYQMYGALSLILTGIIMGDFPEKLLRWAGNAFLFGTIIFAGSLYLICATGVTMWGAVAPIGGAGLMLGWILFISGIRKSM
ncbi:MAG: DUF423 domain-containing protein [Oscillatoriales cyanobacterium RU_3_3]|nr:DUF423 domain-containing protein [Oscillatoriales cyanobacterium RU_3_3]